jgi:hypothetical protein
VPHPKVVRLPRAGMRSSVSNDDRLVGCIGPACPPTSNARDGPSGLCATSMPNNLPSVWARVGTYRALLELLVSPSGRQGFDARCASKTERYLRAFTLACLRFPAIAPSAVRHLQMRGAVAQKPLAVRT